VVTLPSQESAGGTEDTTDVFGGAFSSRMLPVRIRPVALTPRRMEI